MVVVREGEEGHDTQELKKNANGGSGGPNLLPTPPPPPSIRYPDELPFARLFDPDVEPRQGQLRTGHM